MLDHCTSPRRRHGVLHEIGAAGEHRTVVDVALIGDLAGTMSLPDPSRCVRSVFYEWSPLRVQRRKLAARALIRRGQNGSIGVSGPLLLGPRE